jgi:hypothetical protein
MPFLSWGADGGLECGWWMGWLCLVLDFEALGFEVKFDNTR